jgi:hypothetical protein
MYLLRMLGIDWISASETLGCTRVSSRTRPDMRFEWLLRQSVRFSCVAGRGLTSISAFDS